MIDQTAGITWDDFAARLIVFIHLIGFCSQPRPFVVHLAHHHSSFSYGYLSHKTQLLQHSHPEPLQLLQMPGSETQDRGGIPVQTALSAC